MSTPFIGQVVPFGGNFAPMGWALCNGQLLSVSDNSALFSLLGTIYGGDGRTTFGLPDLRSRTTVHSGQGPGLSAISLGSKGGAETVTLTSTQLPNHTHTAQLRAETTKADNAVPTGNMLGNSDADTVYAPPDPADNVAMAAESVVVASAGGNASPINNRGPFTGVNMIIALVGIYPSRN